MRLSPPTDLGVIVEELIGIADKMDDLLPLFQASSLSGLILPTKYSATFKALAIEAKSIIDGELRPANEFSMNLIHAVNSGAGGFAGGPSYASVQEASQIVRAAVRAIQRKLASPPAPASGTRPYVDPARIMALQQIGSGRWDYSRLVELCRELNVAAANRCYISTAMLLRAIVDHVPPTLGFPTFAEVANNYGGSKSHKSFKGSMQSLQLSLRNIADMNLHSAIRQSESLPSEVQVYFAADLDVLLGEVIRVSRQL